jgi:signal transduction histidine kinase
MGKRLEGGNLEIRTDKDNDGENIVISIADTGEGIPEENIEKVFEPFFTTKARGFGLGLSLCKKYVEAHRGRIGIESEVGKGTTLIVKLPINQTVSFKNKN